MTDTLKQVQKQIDELITSKRNELAAIEEKLAAAQAQEAQAATDIIKATTGTDLDAFEDAQARKRKAGAAIEMYKGRLKQIQGQEYISEAESDKVIDSLEAYENEAAEKFDKDVQKHYSALRDLLADYQALVKDTEATIIRWTSNIHKNYRVKGAIYADGTNRSSTPQPVHLVPYTGCPESRRLAEFLKDR